MTLSNCVSEALSNLLSRPVQAVFLALASSALFFAAFFLPWLTMTQAVHSLNSDVAEGRSILIVGSRSGEISTLRCDQLRSVEGIHSAGSVIRGLVAHGDSGQILNVVLATAGLPHVQWADLPPTYRDGAIASSLSVGLGTRVRVEGVDEVFAVSSVASSASRIASLQGAVVVPSSEVATTSECYVSAYPGAEAAVAAIMPWWFGSEAGVRVIPNISGPSSGETAQAIISSNAGAPITLGCAAAIVLLLAISVWSRRHDLAVYQQLGLSRAGALVMALTESVALVFVPGAIGTLAALVIALVLETSSDAVGDAMLGSVMLFLGVLVGPLVGALLHISLGRANAGRL